MANRIMILRGLIRAYEAQEDETYRAVLDAEFCAYMLEPETLDAVGAYVGTDAETVRLDVEKHAGETDPTMTERIAGWLFTARKFASMDKREDNGHAARRHLDAIARTACREPYGQAYTIDAEPLWAAAKAAPTKAMLGFAADGGAVVTFPVAQIRELGRTLRAQDASITARLVKDDTRTSQVHTTERGRKVNGRWTANTVVTRDIENKMRGWSLIVEWTRPSGAKGYLRMRDTGSTSAVGVAHIGLPANDVAAE